MKKILISGCCGFIGSNLCEFLIKKNYKIIGIDNLLTGSLNNISNIINSSNFKFIKHDICYEINIDDDIDYILHFASPASPADYLKFPIKTLQIGSRGTENMLNIALQKKAVILVASTSEIYGDPLEHPQRESYYGNVNPIGPRGVYDEAKRYLEALTMAYNRKFNLQTKIVRIFNTYGSKMREKDGRAIPNFINQALNNNNFTVYGDGNQTRSFTYIDDTVEGIYKLMLSNYSDPFNIGNPVENSINELIELIKNIIPCNSKIEYLDLPENDPKIRKPDIDKAVKLLHWKPKTKLSDGLLKTIEYFRQKNI